jgi:hypothetical protein
MGGENVNGRLKEVDRIEILTLMDNYADVLLGNTRVVRRAGHSGGGEIFSDTLVGEHGLSMLVTVREGGRAHTILFDTGYSTVGSSGGCPAVRLAAESCAHTVHYRF